MQDDKARSLEIQYPLKTREGVLAFLQNINHVKQRIYVSSDYDALIMMIDFERALLLSNLTALELVTINLVFNQDLKRVDVAKMQNITKQSVQKRVERATDKIAAYYAKEGEDDE